MRIDPTFGIESINIRASICNTIFKMVVNSKIGILLWSESLHIYWLYLSISFNLKSSFLVYGYGLRQWNKGQGDRRDECRVRGKSAEWDDWGVKSSGGNGAEGSRRGGEERGLDTKKLIWHICPGFPAPSATINTFTLFVLLSREMRPLRSRVGQKTRIGEGASLIKVLRETCDTSLAIYTMEQERWGCGKVRLTVSFLAGRKSDRIFFCPYLPQCLCCQGCKLLPSSI